MHMICKRRLPISMQATTTLSVTNLQSRSQGKHRDDRRKSIPPTPGAEGAPRRICHPFGRLCLISTSDLDLLCSCITRTSIFKSAASFFSLKALKSVLKTLETSYSNGTLLFAIYYTSAGDRHCGGNGLSRSVLVPSNLSCLSTSHTMMNHVCF